MTGNSSSDDGQGRALPGTTAAGDPPAPVQPTPVLVERATALRGLSISRPLTSKSALRRRSLQEIRSLEPEIPYQQFESATRDLVCSLMERQDRMNEEIFNKIVDLEYRVKDIEIDLHDLMERRRS